MQTPVKAKINRTLIGGFSIVWVLIILFSYLGFHPYYFTSLIKIPNVGLLIGNLILSGGAWAWWVYSSKPGRSRKVNGLQVYGLFLLMQVVTLVLFNSSYNVLDKGPGLLFFLGTNILVHILVFLVFTLAFVAGQPVMQIFGDRYSKGTSGLVSVAVGTSLIALVLFILGSFHVYNTLVAWLLALVLLGVRYQQVLDLWKNTLLKRSVYKINNRWLQLPLFLLLSTLAVNGVAAIKPFPTGFDGAALYMNTTKLITDYQGLIEGGQAYNWQLILSLGEVLFGKPVFSIGLAHFSFILVLLTALRLSRLVMSRSWSWVVVWLLALNPSLSFHYLYDEKVDLGFTFIILSVALLLIEFWSTENKLAASATESQRKLPFGLSQEQGMLLLAGWLLGFAFGIKYTGLLGIISVLAMLGFRYGSYWLAGAVVAFFTGGLFFMGEGNFGYFPFGDTPPYVPGLIAIASGAGFLALAFRQKPQLISFLQSAVLIGGMALLCFSPWAVRNVITNGQFSIQNLLEAPFPTPDFGIEQESGMSFSERATEMVTTRMARAGIELSAGQEQQILQKLEASGASAPRDIDRNSLLKYLRDTVLNASQAKVIERMRTEGKENTFIAIESEEETTPLEENLFSAGKLARREEIQRYLGYESGLLLYASLPYDLTMNTNILKSQYIDIGLLFLALFPILLLMGGDKRIWHNLVLIAVSIGLLLLGIWTIEKQEGVDSIREKLLVGTIPAYENFANGIWTTLNKAQLALAAPLSPVFQAFSNMSFLFVVIGVLILAALLGWILKSRWSGYGDNLKHLLIFLMSFGGLWLLIGSGIPWYGFPMLAVLVVYLVYAALDSTFSYRSLTTWAVGLSLFGYVLLSYTLVFISTLQPSKNAGLIYQEPVLRSFAEGLDRTETLSSFKPYLGEAIEYINQDAADKVYRVGTFFNYHIDFNDRRVLEDNQLGKYDDLTRNLEEEDQFLDLLKANGFRYILFDMNTASLDRTPEQTLTEKTRRFTQMLFTSPKVRLIFTDNVVKGEQGETVPLGKHMIPGRAGIRGETVYRGSYLLFELN